MSSGRTQEEHSDHVPERPDAGQYRADRITVLAAVTATGRSGFGGHALPVRSSNQTHLPSGAQATPQREERDSTSPRPYPDSASRFGSVRHGSAPEKSRTPTHTDVF